MKKNILIFLFAFSLIGGVSAQTFMYGIKGGLNYSKLKFDNINNITTSSSSYNVLESESFQGFHVGVMGRLNVFKLFIQPELYFNTSGGNALVQEVVGGATVSTIKQIKYNKIDLPVLLGYKFGAAHIEVGPVASVVLSTNSELSDIVPDLKTVSKGAQIGFQAGAGLEILKKLSLSVRYEGSLSQIGDKLTVGGNSYAFDSRDSKLLLSVGFFF
ncbi:MAG: PorT family protein [Bacteroidales bacterium]|nr:PorT family protein [Bacteroidales bacterium]